MKLYISVNKSHYKYVYTDNHKLYGIGDTILNAMNSVETEYGIVKENIDKALIWHYKLHLKYILEKL